MALLKKIEKFLVEHGLYEKPFQEKFDITTDPVVSTFPPGFDYANASIWPFETWEELYKKDYLSCYKLAAHIELGRQHMLEKKVLAAYEVSSPYAWYLRTRPQDELLLTCMEPELAREVFGPGYNELLKKFLPVPPVEIHDQTRFDLDPNAELPAVLEPRLIEGLTPPRFEPLTEEETNALAVVFGVVLDPKLDYANTYSWSTDIWLKLTSTHKELAARIGVNYEFLRKLRKHDSLKSKIVRDIAYPPTPFTFSMENRTAENIKNEVDTFPKGGEVIASGKWLPLFFTGVNV